MPNFPTLQGTVKELCNYKDYNVITYELASCVQIDSDKLRYRWWTTEADGRASAPM